MSFNLNIRNKFLIPAVLLIIVGMSVATGVSYIKSKNALTEALRQNIEQNVGSLATILESWLHDRRLDLGSWSHEEIYAKALKDTFVGKAARVNANEKLKGLQQDYGYYEDIALAGGDGSIVASSTEAIIGKINVGDRAYFKAAMAGETFISDVSSSRNTGNPVIFIAAPVHENKTVSGVLFGVVNIDTFSSRFIDSIKVGETGYAYAVSKDGMILAHPVKSNILKLNLNDFDFGKQILSQKNGMIQYTFEGVSKTAAFKEISGLGWIVAVNVPDNEILASAKSLGRINTLVAVVIVAIAIVVIFFVTSTVVKPINSVVAGLRDAAEGDGDLTKRIILKSKDEVGELARWFNTFVEKIQTTVAEVAGNASELNKSSRELADIAEHLSANAVQTSSKAATVSSSSQQMSSTIGSAAGIMEETVSNLTIVAAAAEEMTATISEIAANTEKGREIAEAAVGQTRRATEQIEELGTAADQIGKVVETISEISEQVNLLALNATIEAARAGEAGKGFAVVANEIKELAKQTAIASGEIKQQVEGIQSSTQNTVSEIGNIAKVVGQVNELVATIAAAVEEQSVTTRDIAGNVAKATEGVSEVNMTIADGAEAANSITVEIADVTTASEGMTGSSNQVKASSKELSDLAEKLNVMVQQFKV